MNRSAFIILCCLLTVLLCFRFWTYYHNASNYSNGQEISFTTILSEDPKVTDKFQKLTIFLDKRQPLFVTLPRFPQFSQGQTIHLSGTVDVKVLDNKKPVMTMYLPHVQASKKDQNSIQFIIHLRQKIAGVFHKTLPSDQASLLIGIVLGVKEQTSPEFKDALQKSGVMHVVVASGMNVVMVGGFLSALLSRFMRRQIAFTFTILGITFYALLAGFDAPIVRAAIMGSLVLLAQIMGRQYLAAYGLFLASFFMLLWDPELLVDIGFQLSILATAGLLYLKPLLDRLVRIPYVGDDFTTTIAAQLATLPILFANFGSYSPISILVNILVLWTTPILMIVGGIAAVCAFIFEPLAHLFLYVSLPFLMYFERVVYILHPLFPLEVTTIPFFSMVGYYLILVAIVLIKRK